MLLYSLTFQSVTFKQFSQDENVVAILSVIPMRLNLKASKWNSKLHAKVEDIAPAIVFCNFFKKYAKVYSYSKVLMITKYQLKKHMRSTYTYRNLHE